MSAAYALGECHSCHAPIGADNESPIADTCDDCLTDCLCSDCREVRWQIGEDRAEQAAFDAFREAS